MVIDRLKVEREAKEILDKFAKALEEVEKDNKDLVGSYVDRKDFERIEGNGKDSEVGFKQRILDNAPDKDSDFIIGETGSWK